MSDDFHAYKSNYPPGTTDRDVDERFGGNEVDDDESDQSESLERDTSDE